jgi:hypothetical protein
VTRLLLRFFPAAWRDRYGDELSDLVSETGVSPRVAADIARAGSAERIRAARVALKGGTSMIFAPAWRHPTAWAVAGAIVLVPTLTLVVLAALRTTVAPVDDLLNSQRYLDLALVLGPAFAALLAALPLVRIGFTHIDGGSEASLSVRLRAANVVVVVIGLGVASLLVGHILFESVMQIGA